MANTPIPICTFVSTAIDIIATFAINTEYTKIIVFRL